MRVRVRVRVRVRSRSRSRVRSRSRSRVRGRVRGRVRAHAQQQPASRLAVAGEVARHVDIVAGDVACHAVALGMPHRQRKAPTP